MFLNQCSDIFFMKDHPKWSEMYNFNKNYSNKIEGILSEEEFNYLSKKYKYKLNIEDEYNKNLNVCFKNYKYKGVIFMWSALLSNNTTIYILEQDIRLLNQENVNPAQGDLFE